MRGGAGEDGLTCRPPLDYDVVDHWAELTRLASVSLPVHELTDLFTGRVYSGGETRLADLLATYPVALLAPTPESVEAAS
ncbi:hypothetical protein ACGF5C_04440 [Micromonospora sp. NPDC047620]|uniref:hypothetical protein n=1 Tax=Micromonospora sp. NPDC047620 TaxID=3364251 RepID=UPI00372037F5